MMTSLSEPNLALYQIEQRLSDLLEMRNTAVEEGASPAELEAIDKLFEEYFLREVKKVDGICHALHAFERAADAADEEADRLAQRANSLRDQHNRIKAATLKAMQDHGVRVLETPTNKLRVQANGGLEPLDVPDVKALQLRHTKQTLVFDGSMAAVLTLMLEYCQDKIDDAEARHAAAKIADAMIDGKLEPNGDAIRAALKRGEEVPGAKLLPRSFHLRIE